MSRLYTQRRHEQALGELKAEYDGRLKELQAALAELKEENRSLSAEISLLTAQKQSISDAMIAAGEKRDEMQAQYSLNRKRRSRCRRRKRRRLFWRTCARLIPTKRRPGDFQILKGV